MIYEYHCESCNKLTDVVKPVSQYNDPENCKNCQQLMQKRISIKMTMVDKTAPEYYHSLGTWVKSKYHRNELMKKHDLIEVGSEKCTTLHGEAQKTLRHKLEKRWSEV